MANSVRSSNPLTWLIDPIRPTRESAQPSFRYTWSSMGYMLPLAIGLGALVITLVGWATSPKQFYFSYLVGWAFCVSMALGGLFFVLIQHLTRAKWSVVVRRIPEALAWSFPILAILGIPILFGMHDLYHWTHHELFDPASPDFDPVVAGKEPYLNTPFFLGRLAFYFLSWTLIAYRVYTLSIKQDLDGDGAWSVKLRTTSAWGLALTAVTTSFASFDILMSLDPHWFSTIFGVYFFSGSFMAIMAFMIVIGLTFQRGGLLKQTISTEHYQDLGKFMFGFTIFWAYIAFSQYMLIWYGNLPEETVWYRHRLEHGWEYNSAALLLAHFILPFMILIGRWAKRTLPILGVMAVWMLVMHWFDFHWLVMPVLHEHSEFHLLDFTAVIGLGGITLGLTLYRISRHSMVPAKDPRLAQSLTFINS